MIKWAGGDWVLMGKYNLCPNVASKIILGGLLILVYVIIDMIQVFHVIVTVAFLWAILYFWSVHWSWLVPL